MNIRSKTRIFWYFKSSKGQALVEFAFVLPILIAFLFGTIEFGRVMWAQQVLSNASRAGVREAVLSGTKTTTTINTSIKTALTNTGVKNVVDSQIVWKVSGSVVTDVNTVTQNLPITLSISVPISQVTLSGITYLGLSLGNTNIGYDLRGLTLKGECTMRKES